MEIWIDLKFGLFMFELSGTHLYIRVLVDPDPWVGTRSHAQVTGWSLITTVKSQRLNGIQRGNTTFLEQPSFQRDIQYKTTQKAAVVAT